MLNTTDRVAELARPLAESLGLELWGVEVLSGPGRDLVRVFIDREGGVDVEHCASLSRALGVALDVEEVMPQRYTLEVSSPGLDRQFFSTSQMVPYLGREVDVRLKPGAGDRKHVQGTLAGVDGQVITVAEAGGQSLAIDWSEVRRAHLVYRFPGEADGQSASRQHGRGVPVKEDDDHGDGA